MVQEAAGTKLLKSDFLFLDRKFYASDYGVDSKNTAVENTTALNRLITEVSTQGGGTIVISKGTYRFFTIVLKSYIHLHLQEGTIIQAEAAETTRRGQEKGICGNYKEPEIEQYVGLQDHGHSYLANALVYAENAHDLMISGPGMFFGGEYDEKTGELYYLLDGDDPAEPIFRKEHGHRGTWFGNKGIALKHCERIIIESITFLIGGHFAIITEGVEDLLLEKVLVDTTRDALDLDACRRVTVRDSWFNSLTDDAIVIKSSFGAGTLFRTEDILIEDCTVSGYDAGSVVEKTFETEKMVAADRCGPTARVKLGTESTCGYDRVTIRRVRFDRSRGFAIEAVDGSDATNVIFEDCVLEHVSSSPIFLKAGDRGRFPVTGHHTEGKVAPDQDVRLDQSNWILPRDETYAFFPAKRYAPSYLKDHEVSVDGKAYFTIVDDVQPARINEANLIREGGHIYVDGREITEKESYYYANAYGTDRPARIEHVLIRNVVAKDVDPRYPILIMGMMDGKCRDITLENIDVTYRGGLTMEHAAEQRQLNTWWRYEQFHAGAKVQNLPWLVNTFFLKNEGLLPRFDYDPTQGKFVADPYNVPELPDSYPEPSNWGILPAYGMYARHCENLQVRGMRLCTEVTDGRDGVVWDDVQGGCLQKVDVTGDIAFVSNPYKRPTHMEYCKNYPYQTTTVQEITLDENAAKQIKRITVQAPAPGTPRDAIYDFPTAATLENGFSYERDTADYPIPETVFRPFIQKRKKIQLASGEDTSFEITYRIPAMETLTEQEAKTYMEENQYQVNPVVIGTRREIRLRLEKAAEGIVLEENRIIIHGKKLRSKQGEFTVSLDDGIRKEYQAFSYEVM